MRIHRPTRSLLLLLPLCMISGVFVWATVRPGEVHAQNDPLVASSVCEAHALEALKAENPTLEIQIPKEFDKPFPSAAACLSYAAAEDPDAPGPLQPIPFSHKHHAGLYQIDCQYCHSGTDVSPYAGMPSVELCMGCHAQFPKEYDQEFEGIRVLKQHWEDEEPILWEQIHRLPEYVQFQHRAHLRADVECQTCHGPVEEMDKLYLTPDTIWWPWALPAAKLEMGWCIDCHRANDATTDCYACHY